jgi:23S rRNA pseudouridine2605 synthase
MPIRLVRYLAQCGVASRRGAGDIVQQGLVEVNGTVTSNMALGIEPGDIVKVRGRRVAPPTKSTTLMLNKPEGLVCTRSDPHNPHTIYECIPLRAAKTVKPVGRLDKDSSGLLLLTDDGELAYRLTHPRYGINKVYVATVEGRIGRDAVAALEGGVMLDDGPTAPAKVRVLDQGDTTSRLQVTIHEGRNRQVRRMCEAVGYRVIRLERIQFGNVRLGNLGVGRIVELTEAELRLLRKEVGLV